MKYEKVTLDTTILTKKLTDVFVKRTSKVQKLKNYIRSKRSAIGNSVKTYIREHAKFPNGNIYHSNNTMEGLLTYARPQLLDDNVPITQPKYVKNQKFWNYLYIKLFTRNNGY